MRARVLARAGARALARAFGTNDGLRTRLANIEHVHAQVVGAKQTDYGVEGTLEITVTGDHPARFDEPITLRPN